MPLSPLEPAATPVDPEKLPGSDRGNTDKDKEQQPGRVSTETSTLRPQTPKAEDKAEEDDEDSGPLTISELTYRSVHFHSQTTVKVLAAHCWCLWKQRIGFNSTAERTFLNSLVIYISIFTV